MGAGKRRSRWASIANRGLHRAKRGIGLHLGGVEVEFTSPNETGGDTTCDDLLEETLEDEQTIALTDTRQTGIMWQRLAKIVAKIPAQAEPIGHNLYELTLGAQIFEEHDQLQLEEDDWVD